MVYVAQLFVLALTAAATPILRRDGTTVHNDISQKIGPQTTLLYNDVTAFPDSGLEGSLTIDNDARNLVFFVNDATSDIYRTGPFGESDGVSLLQDFQSVIPTLLDTLSAIQDQVDAWKALPGGQSLVLNDLQSLNATFYNFAQTLKDAEPSDLVDATMTMGRQIEYAFASAIAAYSG